MIRWIGWDVELDRKESKEEIANNSDSDGFGSEKEIDTKLVTVKPLGEEPRDGPSRKFKYRNKEYVFDRYGLTVDGHGICVDAYCVMLASIPNTYVVLHMDKDPGGKVQIDDIDWEEPFNELTSDINPKLTQKHYDDAMNNFCSFHIENLQNLSENHKMDE